ncbi:MAG: hypothetical protein ACI4PE_01250 [Bacilli bacterium]
MEENKKSNKGLIILVVILSILLIGAIGYICYDKLMVKEEPVADNESQVEKLSDEEVAKLHESLVFEHESMFNNRDVDINSITADEIMPYVLKKYSVEKNIDFESDKSKICISEADNKITFFDSISKKNVEKDNVFSISKEEIDNYLKTLFNTDRVFEIDNFSDFGFGDGNYNKYFYSKDDNKFYLGISCQGDSFTMDINSKFLNFKQDNDKVEIYSKVIKCLGGVVCSNTGKAEGKYVSSKDFSYQNDKGFIQDTEFNKGDSINYDYLYEKYSDVFNTYKTTFKKSDDGKYYWYSSEIVNE